jgi:hypothetical protein
MILKRFFIFNYFFISNFNKFSNTSLRNHRPQISVIRQIFTDFQNPKHHKNQRKSVKSAQSAVHEVVQFIIHNSSLIINLCQSKKSFS